MSQVLTLRDIADYTRRRSGRTTQILEICKEHLEFGKGNLLVICLNLQVCLDISHHLRVIVESSATPIKIFRTDMIDNGGGARLYFNSKLESDAYSGVTFKDVIFDVPEYLVFNMEKLSPLFAHLDRSE
jgi:hypothetical protein